MRLKENSIESLPLRLWPKKVPDTSSGPTLAGGDIAIALIPLVVGLLAAFVASGRWRRHLSRPELELLMSRFPVKVLRQNRSILRPDPRTPRLTFCLPRYDMVQNPRDNLPWCKG
jgi:hypothetical protein